MANNRMILICEECWPKGRGLPYPNTNPSFAIAKYYPSSGWYTVREDNKSMNAWLEEHNHKVSDAAFRMVYENDES